MPVSNAFGPLYQDMMPDRAISLLLIGTMRRTVLLFGIAQVPILGTGVAGHGSVMHISAAAPSGPRDLHLFVPSRLTSLFSNAIDLT